MKSFGVLIIVTFVIVGLSILLLGVQTFFSKKKRFPNMHVGGNKALAKKGVFCVQTQDAMARKNARSTSVNEELENETITEGNEK